MTQQNFDILQVLATEAMQMHSRKYSAHIEQDGVTMLQCSKSGSHMRQWVSASLPCACVPQISAERGQSDQRCLQPKSSNQKKVSIYMNKIKQIFYFLPKTKIERISCVNFQMRILVLLLLVVVCLSRAQELSKSIGLYASTGECDVSWVSKISNLEFQPNSYPSQLGSMPPWVIPDSRLAGPRAVQVD